MNKKGFYSKDKHLITKNGFVYSLTKVGSCSWLFEVSITICGDYYVTALSIVRVLEAELLYNKLKSM